MSLRRFVDIFATNPARITGLYPRKGVLAPGSDADLVLWDPAARCTITMDELHHDGDYSPWEGWEIRAGRRRRSCAAGSSSMAAGSCGARTGQFVPRKLDPEVLARPLF